MKNFTKLSLLAALVASSSLAFAADNTGFYAGAKMGISLEQQHGQSVNTGNGTTGIPRDTKQAGNAGLVFGYNFMNDFNLPIRTELDYTYREGTDSYHNVSNLGTNHNRVRVQSVMVNNYYDIQTGTPFTPYVGVGIGYANVKLDQSLAGNTNSGSYDNFAWSVGTGVSYAINSHLDLDVGYKYLDAGKGKANGSEVKVGTHDFTAGVNYYF
ncbi:outer membrane protein [Enterobacillus tribolii]|uniref:Opacity protein-like surface antigen n=1 Tax=Enterobacillus tribolii TaxID=1487935 RepID=A0A370R1J2_9GAMM|nr:outer membrane protein [Enterobacillus tribolii]MBW7983108.1 porin family protein [Enterobacillus tribolii]RDK95788.1 opacity protein-like surface antigen [Enterobacillus tribolii]